MNATATIEDARATAKHLVNVMIAKRMCAGHSWLEGATLASAQTRLLTFVDSASPEWWERNYFGTCQSFWRALTWGAGVPS